jgi:hypothetical protein
MLEEMFKLPADERPADTLWVLDIRLLLILTVDLLRDEKGKVMT